MAVTAKWFGQAFVHAFNKRIDFDSDTIKVALFSSALTPNQDTQAFFSDLTGEVSGTGYTAGGATLSGATVTYTGSTNTLKLAGANVSWPTSTITARYAVVYGSTGTASSSPLIAYVDFGVDFSSSGSSFSLTWDASGIATITVG